ncbi:MAG: NYN domain-containing protein [candidate division WOR-3 bacterium]
MEKRTIIFIDAQALLKGAWKACKKDFRVNHFNLIKDLSLNRDLIRVYMYDGIYPEEAIQFAEERRKKLAWASEFWGRGITVKLIDMRESGRGTYRQKGVDVRIASDMLTLAFRDAYDVAVLVSGDGDFGEVIDEIKGMGKRVEVAYYREGFSERLKESADKIIYLQDLPSFKGCS